MYRRILSVPSSAPPPICPLRRLLTALFGGEIGAAVRREHGGRMGGRSAHRRKCVRTQPNIP